MLLRQVRGTLRITSYNVCYTKLLRYLAGARHLTANQLKAVGTLFGAEIREKLRSELEEKFPHLFEEPPR